MNRFLHLAIITATLTVAAIANAGVQLYRWRLANALAPLVLPVPDGIAPESALQNYISALKKDPEMMDLFEGRTPDVSNSQFEILTDKDRETRSLLIANLPKDFTKNSQRIINFKDIFKQAGQKVYILPVAADLHLNLEDRRDYHQQISERFPFLVAMGGDDVHTTFYKSENIHSKNTIHSRDLSEMNLIKSYIKAEKGFLLGICRGSQITSVALGYKLIQDIPTQTLKSDSHGNDWHWISLKPTTNNLLHKFSGNQTRLFVNSLHHQSVIYKQNGILDLAATGDDKITEATEFKNGRGLLLQFHPEFMQNKLGLDILKNTVRWKNLKTPDRCSQLLLTQ